MPEQRFFEALNHAMFEEMTRDERVFLLGEDIGLVGGTFRVTEGLMAEFGARRVRDTPIAEATIVGLATGAAQGGLRPIAELMTLNFGILAMDQLINHLSKMRYMFGGAVSLPVVVRAAFGGGTQKGAQHSHSIESWFVNVPGIRVVLPSTPYDAKGLLKTAIRSDDPVLFLEHEMLYATRGEVPEEEYLIPFGQAEIKRPGRDVTIISWSRMLLESLDAAEKLSKEGIEAEVVDLRTLDPLDFETVLASAARTRRAVVVEEGWRNVGVGAEIAARLQEHLFYDLEAPVQRVAAADVPTPYAKNLERLALPCADQVVEAVLKATL
ncbi:MAG: alpha-ketoacid dehydrogenase subunit beta [Myxococcales bacterium]|nr:alpha-ketoacid dehydrogenase subunit beta [Myxococcales bacterium]